MFVSTNLWKSKFFEGGGNAQIFSEKVEFDAEPKVESKNPDYKKQGGNVKVMPSIQII